MIIETKIDFKSYLKLMLTLTYRTPGTIVLSIIGFILILISVLYFVGINLMFNEPPYLQIALGFFIMAFLPFSTYRNARKNYLTYDLLQEKIIYEFTDEKIIETGETFDSEMDWTEIYSVLELNDWIIIYHISGSANFLPKESFGENLNEFKELIKRINIPAKLKQ